MPSLDSLHINSSDTIDSISGLTQQMDTVHADSIQALLPDTIISGFLGINHPSLPISENWVFVVLVALFSIMVLSITLSASWLPNSIKVFFHSGDRRTYLEEKVTNILISRLLLLLFSSGAFSLYIYTVNFNLYTSFNIIGFLNYLSLTLAFLFLKYILFQFLGYVFIKKAALRNTTNSYFNLVIYLGLLIFPLLILKIYSSVSLDIYTDTVSLIIGLLAAVIMIIKLIQIFLHKSIASFYLLLYLCTLEILPLILLFQAYRVI